MYAPEFKFMPPPTYTEVRSGAGAAAGGTGTALGGLRLGAEPLQRLSGRSAPSLRWIPAW